MLNTTVLSVELCGIKHLIEFWAWYSLRARRVNVRFLRVLGRGKRIFYGLGAFDRAFL